MAWADYKICDCCGGRKVFYDADIQDERYRATFGEKSDYDPIGLKAICGGCNKTHKVVIVSRGAADRIEALVEAARNEGYRAGLKSMADTIENTKVRLTLGRDWVTADQQELTAQAYRHVARLALAAFDSTKENK